MNEPNYRLLDLLASQYSVEELESMEYSEIIELAKEHNMTVTRSEIQQVIQMIAQP